MTDEKPMDLRPWPWMHTHGGVLHTHMCSFDDGHDHHVGQPPWSEASPGPEDEPAVFERLAEEAS